GQRYILGGRNMMLKELFDVLSSISGRPSPRIRLPLGLALVAGVFDSFASRLVGREPRVPLEGVRMARHKMFVNCSRAEIELGFQAGSIEAAQERTARGYGENNYLKRGPASRQAVAPGSSPPSRAIKEMPP